MLNFSRVLPVAGIALLTCAIMPLGSLQPASGANPMGAVVSEDAVNWTPHLLADGVIAKPNAMAVTQSGQTTYVGGEFHAVEDSTRTTSFARDNLVSFDATNGAISDWAPNPDGDVWAILPVGDSVYVGGEFATISGVSRPVLAKVDAATGAVDPNFNPPFKGGGRVSEIKLVNGRLIVGGTFFKSLLALNPTTGKDTKYIQAGIETKIANTNGKVEVHRFAVDPSGTHLIGVGNFTVVSGQSRVRAFMLDLGPTAATLSDWYYAPLARKCTTNTPARIASLEDVDFSPDGSYFVFAATGNVPSSPAYIGTDVCDGAARFETNIMSPTRPTWINYTGGDTLHTVAATDVAVYVQGHNRWLDNPYGRDSEGPGAVDRLGIGAIDPVTGKALDWNPTKRARIGGHDFFVSSEGLWIVSDSDGFNGRYHRGIAFAPLPN